MHCTLNVKGTEPISPARAVRDKLFFKIVLEAKSLQEVNLSGLSDPYVCLAIIKPTGKGIFLPSVFENTKYR